MIKALAQGRQWIGFTDLSPLFLLSHFRSFAATTGSGSWPLTGPLRPVEVEASSDYESKHMTAEAIGIAVAVAHHSLAAPILIILTLFETLRCRPCWAGPRVTDHCCFSEGGVSTHQTRTAHIRLFCNN